MNKKEQETEKEQLIPKSIALPENFVVALDEIATMGMTSLASVVRVIVRDYLIEKGYEVE